MISSVGPKPSSNEASSEVLCVVEVALICTPRDCNSAVSWSLFQNVGTSVANNVVGIARRSVAG